MLEQEAWGQHKKVHKIQPWLYVTNRGQVETIHLVLLHALMGWKAET